MAYHYVSTWTNALESAFQGTGYASIDYAHGVRFASGYGHRSFVRALAALLSLLDPLLSYVPVTKFVYFKSFFVPIALAKNLLSHHSFSGCDRSIPILAGLIIYHYVSLHPWNPTICSSFIATLWLPMAAQCVLPSFCSRSLFIAPVCYHLLPRSYFTTSPLVLLPWPTTYYHSQPLHLSTFYILVMIVTI